MARRSPPLERAVDRMLGVSRRRRQFAYAAIGTGFALLRPTLRRLASATVVVVAVVGLATVF